jgi:hypothetical protein
MKRAVLVYSLISSLATYAFIYYFLYVLKNNVGLASSALVLLIIMWVTVLTCPLVRNSAAYKNMFKKK